MEKVREEDFGPRVLSVVSATSISLAIRTLTMPIIVNNILTCNSVLLLSFKYPCLLNV